MRVGIDLDGVICNFYKGYEDLIIKISGEDRFGDQKYPVIPLTWNWPQDQFGYSNEIIGLAWDHIKASSEFWFQLDELPDFAVLKGWLDSLNNKHDVYFITDRPGRFAKLQTETWLGVRDLPWSTVLISSDKGKCADALNLDYYIDDRASNISDVNMDSPATIAYLLDKPYNQSTGYQRVMSLDGFLTIVEKEIGFGN